MGDGKGGRREGRRGGGQLGTDRSAYLRPCLCSTDQLPRPSLVALPGPVVAPGANVSLRCAGRIPGMSFALYRVGVATPLQYIDSVQPWADFLLISTHAPGTYCCYYHTPSAPYVLSQRSQPLVISYEGKKLWLSSFRARRPGDVNSIKLKHNSICVSETQKSTKTLGYGNNTLSPSFWLTGSGSLDYTQGNLIRLGLAGMVLICLGIVVTCDWHSRSSASGGLLPQQN